MLWIGHWTFPYLILILQISMAERAQTFDWEEFGTDIYLWFPNTAYLAGGLNPDNVAEAIRTTFVRTQLTLRAASNRHPEKRIRRKLEAFIRNAKNA